MDSNPRLVRKYANRRLYDTMQSRYVNLHDVRDLILSGQYVKVEDQSTKADITNNVLMQIIGGQETSSGPLLSADILTNLIRASANNNDPTLAVRLQHACRSVLKNTY